MPSIEIEPERSSPEIDEILERLDGLFGRAIELAVKSSVATEELDSLVVWINALLRSCHELSAEYLTAQPKQQAEIKTQVEEISQEVHRLAHRYQN
jgi:hypothetical protein